MTSLIRIPILNTLVIVLRGGVLLEYVIRRDDTLRVLLRLTRFSRPHRIELSLVHTAFNANDWC